MKNNCSFNSALYRFRSRLQSKSDIDGSLFLQRQDCCQDRLGSLQTSRSRSQCIYCAQSTCWCHSSPFLQDLCLMSDHQLHVPYRPEQLCYKNRCSAKTLMLPLSCQYALPFASLSIYQLVAPGAPVVGGAVAADSPVAPALEHPLHPHLPSAQGQVPVFPPH